MAKLHCILCDHETNDPEIITHINACHDGLEAYFEAFPSAHVVSGSDDVIRTLDCLSDKDKALITTQIALNRPVRSEIYIEE